MIYSHDFFLTKNSSFLIVKLLLALENNILAPFFLTKNCLCLLLLLENDVLAPLCFNKTLFMSITKLLLTIGNDIMAPLF